VNKAAVLQDLVTSWAGGLGTRPRMRRLLLLDPSVTLAGDVRELLGAEGWVVGLARETTPRFQECNPERSAVGYAPEVPRCVSFCTGPPRCSRVYTFFAVVVGPPR